jgi:hypothetical protein
MARSRTQSLCTLSLYRTSMPWQRNSPTSWSRKADQRTSPGACVSSPCQTPMRRLCKWDCHRGSDLPAEGAPSGPGAEIVHAPSDEESGRAYTARNLDGHPRSFTSHLGAGLGEADGHTRVARTRLNGMHTVFRLPAQRDHLAGCVPRLGTAPMREKPIRLNCSPRCLGYGH